MRVAAGSPAESLFLLFNFLLPLKLLFEVSWGPKKKRALCSSSWVAQTLEKCVPIAPSLLPCCSPHPTRGDSDKTYGKM